MNKDEVLTAFCKLSYKVIDEVFHYQAAADCFCPGKQYHELLTYSFDQRVVDFIREAVEEKIARRDGQNFCDRCGDKLQPGYKRCSDCEDLYGYHPAEMGGR